jgi:hypothetical protein
LEQGLELAGLVGAAARSQSVAWHFCRIASVRQVAELRAGAALPGFAATEPAQMRCWSVSREQLNAAAPLGDLPLSVLGVGEQPVGGELLTALQHELALLTEDASFEMVPGASHESVISDREYARVVARTIQAVVQAARDREQSSSEHSELQM